MPDEINQSSDNPTEDSAIDDLLNSIQSDDPMDHNNEPIPSEDIEPDLLPDADKLKKDDAPTPEKSKEDDEKMKGVGREFINDIRGLIDVAKERFREDRDEAQEVIDYLKQVVMGTATPSVGLVESLVAALKVKTDATANLTRIGDMAAKALTAGRDHIDKETSSSVDMATLYEALATPDYTDETDRKKRRKEKHQDNSEQHDDLESEPTKE